MTHKALQHNQKEDKGKMVKPNVASLIMQLRDIAIKSLTEKINNSNVTVVGGSLDES